MSITKNNHQANVAQVCRDTVVMAPGKSPPGNRPARRGDGSALAPRRRDVGTAAHADVRVKEYMKPFVDLFQCFGMLIDETCMGKLAETMRRLVSCSPKDQIAIMKYKLSALFSWALDQPLPAKPACVEECGFGGERPWILLGGRFYVFVQAMKRRVSKTVESVHFVRGLEFFYSYLMLKKGLPRPTDEVVERGVKDTIDDLSRGRTMSVLLRNVYDFGLEGVVYGPGRVFAEEFRLIDMRKRAGPVEPELEHQVRRTVRELFHQQLGDTMKVGTFPSIRAHVMDRAFRPLMGEAECDDGLPGYDDLPRSRGGAAGFLRWVATEARGDPVCREMQALQDAVIGLPVRVPAPCIYEPFVVIGWVGLWDDWIQPEVPLVLLNDFLFRRYQQRLRELVWFERPWAVPLGLAEALKVRVISKGPAVRYAYLRPLQKFLWRVVKRCNVFCIDRVLTPGDVERCVGLPLPGEVWLSGDYKSATNELHPRLSAVCVDEIAKCVGMDDETRLLFEEAMTDHVIGSDEGRDLREQRWGQLMGSPVSFPVLCIVNAALTRYACFPDRRLAVCPMMINGDDILTRTDHEGVTRWRLATAAGGLAESVGKTYFSNKFCNMNSRCYVRVPHALITSIDDRDHLMEVATLNLGVLYGLKRSGGKVEAGDAFGERDGSLGSRAAELVAPWEANEERCEWLIGRFVAENRSRLPEGLPWFIPECCGGVGIPAKGRYTPSRRDCEIAGAIQRGIVPLPPCSLTVAEETTFTSGYRDASSALVEVFGEGEVDYGGDRLKAHVAFYDYCSLAPGDDLLEVDSDRVSRLTRWWSECAEAILVRDDGQLAGYARHFDPNWRPANQFLACCVV